ncbi:MULTISPECIES: hypothetical protein [Caldilinea]|jgi:hypothetical protein|uniref:Uncharacterized protein n=1 Tax=Caldilinea aerophila (strain DSM 14535 / JCM 11387 / NBRC 104270 / STL-6-O1) TaxID=926550 RepID=I0I3G9_CALAS|nr:MULTISPECIES: hypothetical protein [Caldilinea]MBO9393041.1 hypothetical protein [Caldilinea sp.]BAL99806.1 hypothetical protein CLDAP_17670 [Caldilinea aerophila DSM 14535 = NBRC 104270]GIV73595.1 MAG: hypothetical protein KatS3mg049_2151 [Caldilinea sp.]
MAYTLSDPFRSLRIVLRLCGAADLATGAFFLLWPASSLIEWLGLGFAPLWPLRLAGATLLTLGLFYLLASGERSIGLSTQVTCTLGNGLPAVLVVVAYLQREMAAFTWPAQTVMLILFTLWLIGAVTPLRFLRTSYQD